jgi:hypothetical protein
MLAYLSLLVLNALALIVLIVPIYTFLLLGILLGGKNADGGLAQVFCKISETLADVVGKIHNAMSARKCVAFTFGGAVRYWRKQLVIARDIDSKNWEPLADIKRYAMGKLPKGFGFGANPGDKDNAYFKQFRFAKYVIGKRKAGEEPW